MQKISNLFDLLVKKGANKQYGGENVTQLEHAIQCAELAEKNNKSEKFIVFIISVFVLFSKLFLISGTIPAIS